MRGRWPPDHRPRWEQAFGRRRSRPL